MDAAALLSDFAKYLEFEQGCAKTTVAGYRYGASRYLAFLIKRKLEPGQADTIVLSDYFQERSHLKPASRFAGCMALRSFYQFLQARGFATTNPAAAIKPPAPKSRIPDLLTEEEVNKLLSVPTARFPQIRDRAIMELLYCGLRVSEALDLEHDRIHLEEGQLRVIGKGGRERWVPIGTPARQALECYFTAKAKRAFELSGAVFITRRGRKLSRTSFWLRLKLHAGQAGITKPIYPHLLRHCFASHVLHRGADLKSLQSLLGHAHLSSSARYLHTTPHQVAQVFQRTHPRS